MGDVNQEEVKWQHMPATNGRYEIWYIGEDWAKFDYRVIKQTPDAHTPRWLLQRWPGSAEWNGGIVSVYLPIADYTPEEAMALCPLLTRIE